MKNVYMIALVFSLFNVSQAQNIETLTVSGGKTYGDHKILIYTPAEYSDRNRKFEVIYVLDAQQREFFDAVHTTIAFQTLGFRPMIVVGISSNNRNYDFLPENKFPETTQEIAGPIGGAAVALPASICNLIKPTIFLAMNMYLLNMATHCEDRA